MTAQPAQLDSDKLFAARLLAVRARPYLATALYALHVVKSRRVPTMGVDRYWRCYASPAFVDHTSVEELASILVHEVSHLLRDHHGRSERFAREHSLTGPKAPSCQRLWACPKGNSWRTTYDSSA